MKIENEFTVARPCSEAWAILMDIKRIAPCMPGAEITDIVDSNTFRGRVLVHLGPVAISFSGTAKFQTIDQNNYQATVAASGSDPKGRGNAEANIKFSLIEDGSSSRVKIHTDLQLSGSVAQYGRGAGMISALATKLVNEFAKNLDSQLTIEESSADPATGETERKSQKSTFTPPETKPIAGIQLGLSILWMAIKKFFGKN